MAGAGFGWLGLQGAALAAGGRGPLAVKAAASSRQSEACHFPVHQRRHFSGGHIRPEA